MVDVLMPVQDKQIPVPDSLSNGDRCKIKVTFIMTCLEVCSAECGSLPISHKVKALDFFAFSMSRASPYISPST